MSSHYGGVYRGIVRDIADPERRRRIRVIVPSLMGDALLPWAMPCQPPGATGVPEIGQGVWIMFEDARVKSPVWVGVWQGQAGRFAGTFLGGHIGTSVGSHVSATVTYAVDATNARISATTGTQTAYSFTTHGH